MQHASPWWPRLLSLIAVGLHLAVCAAAPPHYDVVVLPFLGPKHDTFSTTEAIALDERARVVVRGYQTNAGIWGDRCTRHECVRVPALWEIGLGAVSDINSHGTVVASSPQVVFTPDRIETYHGYLFRRNGSLKVVYGFPEDECDGCTLYSYAYAANDDETVVGIAEGADGRRHAAIWNRNGTTDLGTLGGAYSEAMDINNLGTVVGRSDNAAGQTRSFVVRDGGLHDLGTLGGQTTQAFRINSSGVIVGCSSLADETSVAFRFIGDAIEPLPSPAGSVLSCAVSVNDAGHAVGWFGPAQAEQKTKGFLFDGSSSYDLNTLLMQPARSRWQITAANDINNKGQIAATGRNKKDGTVRALLLLPVEP